MLPSSASSTPKIRAHDVFLSFRGEDTRNTFTDHLYDALNQRGIDTFRDDKKLKRGTFIGPELLKAIEESSFAVVILSKEYASSTWCLDELAHIVECMKKRELQVFPVFYHVKPSEVRNQTGSLSQAFAKHEEKTVLLGEVGKWRKALTEIAIISGWVLDKASKEAEVTQAIAEKISTILHCMPSFSEDLIGMGPRIEKMESLLDLKERDDVRTIGIWGMGGIGKTTLAELVYNKICNQFQTSHFLPDVRKESEKQGLVSLQNLLFEKLLRGSGDDIHNVHMGMSSLKRRLHTKKVLIVLDDVDHQKQIQALVGNDWLGRGSRVIITTRDEQLLKAYGAHHIFEVEKLNDEEAFQLFCKKAFKKGHEMADDYTKLSQGFAKYSNGLPLALEVLGGALCGKTVAEWESKFAKLKEYPDDKDIFPVLQISYDGLEETEKQIFLDIACFFKGEDHNRVDKILDACHFHPTIGIRVLQDKCLVKINKGNRLWMHDLIQQMGWSIVHGESSEPGKRSRLWVSENVSKYKDSRSWDDVNTVLEDNLGTIAVHGIFLTLPAKEEIELDADPFSNMRGLKLLKICNANFSECPEYFSRQLRLLEWHEYPLESLTPSFRPSSLVELRLPNSRIKQLWHEMRVPMMEKLTLIDLSHCKCLTKTPDFSKVPNLMGLTLEGCEKLSELHPTIWDLQHLVSLNLKGCECLESLPHSICLESLQNFVLSGCSRLESFPEIVGNMGHLSELHLDGTGVRELPLSIKHLTGLIVLNLRECKNLLSVPSIICSLASLKYLFLSGCSLIDQLPENIGSLELLKELDACQTAIRRLPLSILLLKNLQRLCLFGCTGLQLPHSFSGLSSLVYLNLSGCGLGEGAIPDDIGICLSSLRSLGLSENNFESIPESISQLSELRELTLFKCCNLRLLPKPLPPSLKHLDAHGCPSQTNYPKTLNIWTSDDGICFIDCRESEGDLIDRQQDFELRVPYTRIPDWCNPEDSIWMGVVLFVFFEILEQSSEMEETFCHFHASDGRLQNRVVIGNFENFIVGSHAVCCYKPARKFAGNLKKANHGVLRASVSTNRPSLKVKGCGIRLISHQDAAKFAQDLSQTANQHLVSNFGSHCKHMLDEVMKLESSGDVTILDYRLQEPPSTSTVHGGRSSSSTTASTDSSIPPVQLLLSKLYEVTPSVSISIYACVRIMYKGQKSKFMFKAVDF
ncbi:PREDICTED: TMV resistance N [Prunus dulcis]|uniref:PREDICTED: TMV resistance N n=1 Tax=Prunus dulcis TaxID=3755 RepID=A0A5E4GHK8_PRUDU|nr:PREDICTED: TMV resistance N [Prunus dulcis]